jgi:hypothetical protein
LTNWPLVSGKSKSDISGTTKFGGIHNYDLHDLLHLKLQLRASFCLTNWPLVSGKSKSDISSTTKFGEIHIHDLYEFARLEVAAKGELLFDKLASG